MSRIAKRPTKITNGMCEHGCCDGCPHGCFDELSDLDLKMYDEFQRRLRAREFCIGWHPVDSQKKTYYQAIYDSWHEANETAHVMAGDHPEVVVFVEAVIDTKKCDKCNGAGFDDDNDPCAHCHGKGRVRA